MNHYMIVFILDTSDWYQINYIQLFNRFLFGHSELTAIYSRDTNVYAWTVFY